MKKIIPLLLVLAFACTKPKQTPPAQPANTYKAGLVEIAVTSNHMFPSLQVDKDGVYYKKINQNMTWSGYADSSEVNLSFNGYGKYFIYIQAAKHQLDTTRNMWENSPIWTRLVVKVSGKVIADQSSFEKPTTKQYTINSYEFTLN